MSKDKVVFNKPGPCQKCGLQLYCRHDVGSSGNDPVDDFRLFCPKCGEVNKFVHTDMGNDQETCPWCGQTADKLGTEIQYIWHYGPKVHRLSHTRLGETPGGNDWDVYVAVCSEEFESWSYAGASLPCIGSLEQAQISGWEFCESCF